jgi:hypothetical protein
MQDARDWWRGPKGVGAAGVVLLAGGYAALASLSDAAGAIDNHQLAALARVVFYAGVFLVLAAAVWWYRQPPAPPVDPDDEIEPEGG